MLNKDPSFEQEYTTLERIDVNGMTVSEACEKLRDKGWQIKEVAGKNKYTTKSDCSDTEHKVVSTYYHTEKFLFDGSLRSDYEKVTISFDDPKEDSTSGSSSSSSSSSSGSNSSSSSSSSSNTSSSTNASFRKAMDDYESFMNKYVDFMKKYKNSSDTMSMLADYSQMMQDYAKFADSISGYNQSNLSASDWSYYLEVTTRVNKKLLEV